MEKPSYLNFDSEHIPGRLILTIGKVLNAIRSAKVVRVALVKNSPSGIKKRNCKQGRTI